jgi:hypothetical protein
MWKKLSLIAAMLSLAALVALPLAAPGAKPPAGGGGKTMPSGPGRISVSLQGWVTLVNPDGTNPTPIATTYQLGWKTSGDRTFWSPVLADGTAKIAYFDLYSRSDTGVGYYCLMVIDGYPTPAAGTSVMLIPPQVYGHGVAWSPADPPDENGIQRVRLAYSGIDGMKIQDLLYDTTQGTFTFGSSLTVPYPCGDLSQPNTVPYYDYAAFSPDGQWLALGLLWSSLPNGMYARSIWLVRTVANADGSPPVPQKLIYDDTIRNWEPVWSPVRMSDGNYWLAFTSDRAGLASDETYLAPFLDVGGVQAVGPVQRLTNTSKILRKGGPTWSPDGKQIAYSIIGSHAPGQFGKVILATGQAYTVADGMCPSWSPDVPPLP